LVLHGVSGQVGDKATESQANEFAAAFLMPQMTSRPIFPTNSIENGRRYPVRSPGCLRWIAEVSSAGRTL
jgi:hypothetical protein